MVNQSKTDQNINIFTEFLQDYYKIDISKHSPETSLEEFKHLHLQHYESIYLTLCEMGVDMEKVRDHPHFNSPNPAYYILYPLFYLLNAFIKILKTVLKGKSLNKLTKNDFQFHDDLKLKLFIIAIYERKWIAEKDITAQQLKYIQPFFKTST